MAKLNGRWLNKSRYLNEPKFDVGSHSGSADLQTLVIGVPTTSGVNPNIAVLFSITNPTPAAGTLINVYSKIDAGAYSLEASLSGDAVNYQSPSTKTTGHTWTYYVTVTDGVTEGPHSNTASISF